ncbi:MAG: hypothetical protein RRY76_02700 [Clostridia bacterium]
METGRTHQIRVHLAHIGHAVTGDDVYGRQKNEFGLVGQCLFAKFISFEHPITGEVLSFEGVRPDFFCKTLDILKKRNV